MKIAVVGAGISGLAATYLLSRAHEVTLFEREGRPAGHAHTQMVRTAEGTRPVDTGFMVFNERTYPNFVRLLGQLGVDSRPNEMSFSVRCRRCGLEYSSRGLGGLLAQPWRAVDPRHLRMMADALRFFRDGKALLRLAEVDDPSLDTFPQQGRYSQWFVRHFLLPMAGAIWSAPGRDIRAFPARSTSVICRDESSPASLTYDLTRLQGWRTGRLTVHLPDGARHAFGAADEPSVHLRVHSPALFRKFALSGDLGAGESYMDDDWSADDLPQLLELVLRNGHALALDSRLSKLLNLPNDWLHRRRRNTRAGSRRNIGDHYDLGNDCYSLFLDETMTYSSAVFGDTDRPLAEAQREKYRALARRIRLRSGQHVLEIGCGWGGFAELAARECGARVTGITVSREQHDYALARIARAGLADRVQILLCDYRDVAGTFDHVVSIEMLEAFGRDYACTLAAWRQSFLRRLSEVRALGFDDRFIRMRDYYLSACEAAFRVRLLGTMQITWARAGEDLR